MPEILADFDALVVRSSTQVTAELMRAGKRLKVVGRAGIGVDNVDVAAATELGILVVNAPTANLMSATEHTFALLLSLARKMPAGRRLDEGGGVGPQDHRRGAPGQDAGHHRLRPHRPEGGGPGARGFEMKVAGLRPVPRRRRGPPAGGRAAAAGRAAGAARTWSPSTRR